MLNEKHEIYLLLPHFNFCLGQEISPEKLDLYKRRLKNRLKTSMQMMTWEWSLAWRFKAAKKSVMEFLALNSWSIFCQEIILPILTLKTLHFLYHFFSRLPSSFVTHLWTDKEFPYCVLKKLVKSISFPFAEFLMAIMVSKVPLLPFVMHFFSPSSQRPTSLNSTDAWEHFSTSYHHFSAGQHWLTMWILSEYYNPLFAQVLPGSESVKKWFLPASLNRQRIWWSFDP